MDRPDERDQRIRELEQRLALLSQASLRVNESLDFDTVLQGVMDSARSCPNNGFHLTPLLPPQRHQST